MDNSNKLTDLEKKLDIVQNRLMIQRNKQRFRETKLKRSYGKMFLMAGALDYYAKDVVVSDKDVIEIGALIITAKCNNFKIAIILGALNLTFEKCKEDSYYQNCVDLGTQFYESKELPEPNSFFLGVALKATKLLADFKNIPLCEEIGDQLFTENKQRKLEKYNQYIAQKNVKIDVLE
jgi:hypothetical protein